MKGCSPVWAGGRIYQFLTIKLAENVKMGLSHLETSFGMAWVMENGHTTWILECHKSLWSDLQTLSAPTNAQCYILRILLLIFPIIFF